MSVVLSIKSLSKSFNGVKALDDLSFDVPHGQITGIIGPNGSGKTTLFNIISGLLKPSSGQVELEGRRLTGMPPYEIARAGIGRTFQIIRLCPQMSVLENVMLALPGLHGDRIDNAITRSKASIAEELENRQQAMILLEQVGMAERANRLASELSFGQRRLTEIARALALDPKVVLLDEPMSGLFPQAIEQMMTIIRSLDQSGKTILFIEHNLHVVMELSEHVVVLNHGRMIAEGKPAEIKSNPVVIEAYLGRRRSLAT